MSRSRPARSDPTASSSTAGSNAPGSAAGTARRRRLTPDSIDAAGRAAPSAPASRAGRTGTTTDPHARGKGKSTSPARGYTRGGLKSNTQGAKATRSGKRGEERVDRVLAELGLSPQARSRLTGTRLSGKGQILDNAVWVPELDGLVEPVQTADGALVNCVISVKTQKSDGSVERKLPTEVHDLGHYTNTEGLPAVCVLSTPNFTARQIDEIRAWGEAEGVGVVTFEELCSGRVVAEALRAYQRRGPVRDPAMQAELLALKERYGVTSLMWLVNQHVADAVFVRTPR